MEIEMENTNENKLKDLSNGELQERISSIIRETDMMKREIRRVAYDVKTLKENYKDNLEKIKLNKQLPFLVGNVIEILDLSEEEKLNEEDFAGDGMVEDSSKAVVVKGTDRKTMYLPVVGLVPLEELKINDLVGLNKD